MKRFFFLNILTLSILFLPLVASEDGFFIEEESHLKFPPIYKFSLGPEFYHVKRTREGGTSQNGTALGVRGSLERIGRYKWYFGIEGLYGDGTIKGHSGSGAGIKSKLTDKLIEGRVGYTFQGNCGLLPSLTPFLGYGYSEETNDYKFPSPLLVKFKNTAPYCSFGFLSSITVMQNLLVGFNVKARLLVDAKCIVKDPVFDNLKMHINDKLQYRFEVPLYYDFYGYCRVFELGFVPFYEFRHYGGRENYPFDFLDTKLKIYGINIQFTYRF